MTSDFDKLIQDKITSIEQNHTIFDDDVMIGEDFYKKPSKKQRMLEWQKECEKAKKSPTYLIERYCDEIHDEVSYYEQTFEEMEKADKENQKYRREINRKEINERVQLHQKPKGMSDKEYANWKKEYRKQRIQENKQNRADTAIKEHTPNQLVYQKIMAIDCRCEPQDLRQGKYCDTCKLLMKVDSNMMSLFKEAAEGRTTIR